MSVTYLKNLVPVKFTGCNIPHINNFTIRFFQKKKKPFQVVCVKSMYFHFENLTIELHILYVLNTHIKFCANWILLIIQSIILHFMHNFKL